MNTANIEILPHGDVALLEPLTCKCAPLDLELGTGTWRSTILDRWAPLSEFGAVRVVSDFWPSAALIEQAKNALAAGQSVTVSDADGVVAECGAGNSVALTADDASFRIVYPWHVLKMNEECLAATVLENKFEGTVRERVTIDGTVFLGEGSVILPGVYIEGVARIGKNCKIGPNCYLRGNNFIGDKCHIGQAVEIKNCVLMTHVAAGHLSYIGDSIVCRNVNFGAGTITSNFRHDGKNHRSMVNGCLLDTGRRKFGAIIGENVHTGIHTAVYPGRKIWADMSTRPGDVIQRDLTRRDD